ncbi:MAG: hypothetical protein OXD50_14385 [Chloroflexi bacterium]|nr:hypothetical protein [Chloroflexota bacterium]
MNILTALVERMLLLVGGPARATKRDINNQAAGETNYDTRREISGF